jgi:hypothetical protein
MKSGVVFHDVNVYLELGCMGNECITLQSTRYFHYQNAAASILIKCHILDGLYYSVLRHFVNLFQCVGVLYIIRQKFLNYK